ncbi:MAG: YraN family protein [Gemmatimonadales bacterium]
MLGHSPERLASWAESVAADHLRRQGLRILDRNWRAGHRELDIVAQEGDVVAFVEVKARGPGPQDPLEAIGRTKRRDIRRAAERWIHSHPGVGSEFRFDAIGVRAGGSGVRILHVRGAFTGDDT